MMKSLLTFAKAASVILLHADPGSSQVPDRVYPFTELSDEDVARLDLRDGTVFDWLDIVGEPSLTALDFHTNPQYSDYDPSSFDFRVWLAWHDAMDHLYVAVQSTDDIYINEYERYGEGYKSHIILHDSAVHFYVDGDRSGGEWIAKAGISEEENLDVLSVQAQGYDATAGNFENDSNLQLLWHLVDQSHAPGFLLPPYADERWRLCERAAGDLCRRVFCHCFRPFCLGQSRRKRDFRPLPRQVHCLRNRSWGYRTQPI